MNYIVDIVNDIDYIACTHHHKLEITVDLNSSLFSYSIGTGEKMVAQEPQVKFEIKYLRNKCEE